MGIYYQIVNVDKKEALSPHDFGHGAKMAEWCYHETAIVLALHNLLAGRWKGDRVYVVSDDLAEVDDSYSRALAEARKEFGVRGLYSFACKQCKALQPDEVDTADHGLRYIYNHDLEVFVDLQHCPANRDDIAPLPLLISIGHDCAGGGNFDFEVNDEDVAEAMEEAMGAWVDSVRSIEVRKEPLQDVDYEEFTPNFSEMGLERLYLLANVDKREYFDTYMLTMRDLGDIHRSDTSLDLMNLLTRRWKGDRVYVVAIDAQSGWEFPGNEDVCDAIAQGGYKGLYPYVCEQYASLEASERDSLDHGLRYIYNHALKVYIDLEHCPSDGGTAAMPLPLLLAIGNLGDSLEDYPAAGDGFEHLGAWCETARSIELSKEPLPGVDYAEFRPDFLPVDKWDDAMGNEDEDEDD